MIIAVRKLKIVPPGAPAEVPVTIHRPAPEPTGRPWRCNFDIGWPEGADTSYAMGEDAVQALNLALQKIATLLYASHYHHRGELVWLEPGQGYGFPLHRLARDLAIGDDRLM